jgi:hypothetical protein
MVNDKIPTQELVNIYEKYGTDGLLHYVKEDKSITIDLFRRIALMHTDELHVFFVTNHKNNTVEPTTRDKLLSLLTGQISGNIIKRNSKYLFGGMGLIVVLWNLLMKTVYTLNSIPNMTPADKITHDTERQSNQQLGKHETFRPGLAKLYGKKNNVLETEGSARQSLPSILLGSQTYSGHTHRSTTRLISIQKTHSILTDDTTLKYISLGIVGTTLIGLLGLKYWKKNHNKSQLIHVKNEINESPKDEMDYNNNFEDNMILHKAFLKSKSVGELRYQLLQLNNKKLLDLDVHFFVRKDGTLRNSFDEIARAIEHYPTSRWNKTMKWFNMYTPKKKLRRNQSKKRSRSRSHKK